MNLTNRDKGKKKPSCCQEGAGWLDWQLVGGLFGNSAFASEGTTFSSHFLNFDLAKIDKYPTIGAGACAGRGYH
jgi:hypothetical protein